MRRLLPLIASFMVLLIVWSGSAAHAAEAVGPAAAEAGLHSEGDSDQVPADDHQPVPHHHGTCHADHIGLTAGLPPAATVPPVEAAPQAAITPRLPSAGPGAALRPPIA